MRILHIDENFHTQYGYHTAPLAAEMVKQGHEAYIITVPADKLYPVFKEFGDTTSPEQIVEYDLQFESDYGVHIFRCPIYRYISYRAIYKPSVFKMIDMIHPDVILCHNSDSYMAIRMILRKDRFPVVYDSHMLSMASRNKFARIYRFVYKNFVSPSLRSKKSVVIRTQDDPYVINMGVPEEQAPFISFGSDMSLFHPDARAKNELRKQLGISENDFVIVYTGKLNADKGGQLLADTARDIFVSPYYRSVVFLVVGNTTGEYGKAVDKAFAESRNRIIRVPTKRYRDLPPYYQAADLSVFPRQCSMSFYDAQACGVPVLSEDNNVNIERCSHGNGSNFRSDDMLDFRKQIDAYLNMAPEEYNSMKKKAYQFVRNNYSYERIAAQYTKILESAVGKQQK